MLLKWLGWGMFRKELGEGRGGEPPIETIRDPRGGRARLIGSMKLESSSTTATRITARELLTNIC